MNNCTVILNSDFDVDSYLDELHSHLSKAYWSVGIPIDTVREAFLNSSRSAVIDYGTSQILAWARLITDYSTFGYLADVFVVPERRGTGLGRLVVESLLEQPFAKRLRRIALVTRDAHGLYMNCAFSPLDHPDRWMQINRADIYKG